MSAFVVILKRFVAVLLLLVLQICNTVYMDLTEYVKGQTGMSVRSLAMSMGYDQSKLNRHLKGDATMETLRDISRVTKLNFLDLCTLCGFLRADEVRALKADSSLAEATDEDLAREVLNRMKAGSKALGVQVDAFQDSHALAAYKGEHDEGVDPYEG